jgi:A/G-specific adenine glycosylase
MEENEATGLLVAGLETKRTSLWRSLLAWADRHPSRYPWRRTGSPYRVLIGELLLAAARPAPVDVSESFLRAFPTVGDLLAAEEATVDGVLQGLKMQQHRDAIMKLISGLAMDGTGGLPCDSETLARISGLERHHIRAVFCFGYALPLAVVDKHVRRMLKRIFAGSLPHHPSNGLIDTIAESLVFYRDPQTYNAVLLDLADLVCRLELPSCRTCPVSSFCDSASGPGIPRSSPVISSNRSLVKTG